jgi:hypothetical protein
MRATATKRSTTKRKTNNRWVQRAVSRPGRVRKAAKRDNLSVTEEARKMARSGDKSAASAGRLALRFKGEAKRGNFRKKKRSTSRRSM